MSTNDEILEEITRTAAVALFGDYGAASVKSAASSQPQSLSYAGVIGFTGESMRGTMMLGMSGGALARVKQTGAERPREWIGELSNQLLGRIKNRLLRFGVEIYLSTPVVIRGEHLANDGPADLRAIRLEVDGEGVTVWMDREEIGGLVLTETTEAAANEGDVFLF